MLSPNSPVASGADETTVVQRYSSQYPHIPIDDDGVLLLNPDRVMYFHLNPRKKFRKIAGLATAIKTKGKQLKPGSVRIPARDPNYQAELVDGERRIRAMKMLHDENPKWLFRAIPDSSVTDDKSQFVNSYAANFGHEPHDCMETAWAIKQLVDFGHTLQEIGAMSGGKSGAWASQQLNLLKLDERIQHMLVPGEDEEEDSKRRLTPSLAQTLVGLDPETQYATALQITEQKMTMVQARRHILQVKRKLGKPATISKRKKGESFQALLTFTQTMADNLGIYTDLGPSERELLFKDQSVPVLKLLLQRINHLTQDLGELKSAVETSMK